MRLEKKTIEKIIKSKYCCIGSDGLYGENPHLRTYGYFIRVVKYFVKDKKILTLKEAIHKMTYKPIKKLNLKLRGLIQQDYYADLVIIDMNKLDDLANYSNPCEKPKGIEYVILNGNLLVEKGKFNNIFVGKVIHL